ncbi:SHOCT domain-containing protein [Niabella drilacis]|uniref:Short C-terminal domain-containing protein n=1 Tax=Niabella drilacis (strain DSM 25811 / CCM 8410 / CCUG 62505 / LMG 26954 / E90) TaxID=1285928 RepID=A0A1G6XFU2_NIADE|nr:SHOCT domain-containing protein [Niabella drilacis]SDD77040.1 Short C-terminal domain-containing protein [Niabella drilacis]
MRYFFIFLALISNQVFAQKIYVDCEDQKPKGSIEKKIGELNFIVVQDSTKADIKARFVYQKAKTAMSFKVKPNIYAKILFYSKDDQFLSATEEVGGLTAAWSGYNPRVDAAWKILSRDFENSLKSAITIIYKNEKVADSPLEKETKADSKVDDEKSLSAELIKLKKLYDDGALSEDEYKAAKKKLLDPKK